MAHNIDQSRYVFQMTEDIRCGLSGSDLYVPMAWYFLDEHRLLNGPYDSEADALVGLAEHLEELANT